MSFTRVTDVLYPFSGLSNIPRNILDAAAARGTAVHEVCDALIKGLSDCNDDPLLQGYVESFKKWFQNKNFIPKPERFYCEKHQLTGECDAIYESNDGLVLVDFKTTAKEGKTWQLQGSAYSYLARQRGLDIKKMEFVKLSKTGEIAEVFTYKEDFDLFLKCLDLYRIFFIRKSEENPLDLL